MVSNKKHKILSPAGFLMGGRVRSTRKLTVVERLADFLCCCNPQSSFVVSLFLVCHVLLYDGDGDDGCPVKTRPRLCWQLAPYVQLPPWYSCPVKQNQYSELRGSRFIVILIWLLYTVPGIIDLRVVYTTVSTAYTWYDSNIVLSSRIRWLV